MKKKILALCLVVVLAVTAVTGATLAYFTDTDEATNTFTIGDVNITLEEDFPEDELMPGDKTHNNLKKEVTVKNDGPNDAYMWIEVWVPAALDDGDGNSPEAPGLGNSLHFNYAQNVVETKATYLGSQYMKADAEGNMSVCNAGDAGAAKYNGYVHYVKDDTAKAVNVSTSALLDQVYMDKDCTQCTDASHAANCIVLLDGTTHYTGLWNLHINAIGFQSQGFEKITDAISEYYGVDVTAHIW